MPANMIKTSLSSPVKTFTEQELLEQLEFVIKHEYIDKKLKNHRVSKKLQVVFHVDNSDKLPSILGEDVYKESIRNTAQQLKLNEEELVKNRSAYVIVNDDVSSINATIEKKLVENGVQYRRALYKNERIDSLGRKYIEIPGQFSHLRSRVLERLSLVTGVVDLQKREQAYNSIVENKTNMLSKERVWKLFGALLKETSAKDLVYYRLNMEKIDNNIDDKKFWLHEVNFVFCFNFIYNEDLMNKLFY